MATIRAAIRCARRWSALGIGLALLVAGPATAWAGPATHQVIPATELPPIVCEGGTYIGVSGSFMFVAREGTAASGNTQFGGTATAHDVIVTNGSSFYSLRGASSFSVEQNAQSGAVRSTAGIHFQIIGPTGVVDSVRVIARLVDDGTIQLSHGTCERPG
jgi:hypothetical protein